MSNLLPMPVEREVIRLYRARIWIAVSLFLIGTGIAAAIILLPSYLIVKKHHASLEAGIASLSAPAASASDRDLLKHIQSRVGELTPLVATTTSAPSDSIIAALALRPAGLSVDHISYSTGKTASILLSGSSKAGDQVSVYQRALAASEHFAGVSVPVGALAGVNEGHFNITIINK